MSDTKSTEDDEGEEVSRGSAARERERAKGSEGARRARGYGSERKERVLHTRVSEQLSEDIRRLAEDLRVPASNLVRNVLEEVFTMVESVSDDVGDLFGDVLDEAAGARERIRRHARRRGTQRRGGRRGRGSTEGDDVEAELSRDEAREVAEEEARSASRGRRGGASAAGRESAGDERAGVPAFPEVIGWQPLVLNHDLECASCRVPLPRGSRAFVGLEARGFSRTALCRSCAGSD